MQSVGRGEVARLPASGAHAVGVLTYLTHFVLADLDAGLDGGVDQRAVQDCPSHAAPGASLEFRVDLPRAVPIADSPDRLAVRVHRKALQMTQGMRHQPLAARLVDHALAPFGDNDFQSGAGAMDRRGQTGRATADDEKIDHVRPASAAFSTFTRVLSSHTLSAENTNAVIHAVCTSGNATPSAMTAT